MSDSELSDAPSSSAPPPDAVLERSLRGEVEKKFKANERDQLTVNAIRTLSEQSLGLREGFYTAHESWKAKSKNIIKGEVDRQDAVLSSVVSPPHLVPRKRSSPEPAVEPRKKRKTASPPVEEAADTQSSPLSELSSMEDESELGRKPKKKSTGKATKPKKSASKTNGLAATTKSPKKDKMRNTKPADDSESELSSLVDEDALSKGRRKSKDPPEKKSKGSSKPKSKAQADDDPDTAEIKRLQGWLVKCGIRKLWGKELKPYGTSKAKIKHLKDMLADAGMTGRYSVEKAAQIKEARELAADIEAVKEGNERWGKDGSEDESANQGRPKRRLIRGAQNYDFLSSGGEETD